MNLRCPLVCLRLPVVPEVTHIVTLASFVYSQRLTSTQFGLHEKDSYTAPDSIRPVVATFGPHSSVKHIFKCPTFFSRFNDTTCSYDSSQSRGCVSTCVNSGELNPTVIPKNTTLFQCTLV